MAGATGKQNKLLNSARTRFEYMACVRIAGGSEEKMQRQSEATVNSIASQLQTVTNLTPEIGVELLKMVNESQLFEKDKAFCAEKIQVQVDIDEDSGGADTDKQTHDYFHEYIQKEHMGEEAFRPTADIDTRLRIYARLARAIGLNYPNENTMAKITACAFPELMTDNCFRFAHPAEAKQSSESRAQRPETIRKVSEKLIGML